MSNFLSDRKFNKIARLAPRTGSSGDQILCGFLDNGTEVLVTPDRDRAAYPGGFILMTRGHAGPTLGVGQRRLVPPPQEPYRPGASQMRAQQQDGPVDTAIEIATRHLLSTIGVRFEEKLSDLPGTPDFYLPDLHVALLAHGCFWHGHACASSRPPHATSDRAAKIRRSVERDPTVRDRLLRLGLRVLVVWECAVTGPDSLPKTALRLDCEEFFTSDIAFAEIVGR